MVNSKVVNNGIDVEINGEKKRIIKIPGIVEYIRTLNQGGPEKLEIVLQGGKGNLEMKLLFEKREEDSGKDIISPRDRIKAGVILDSNRKIEDGLEALYILKRGKMGKPEIYYRKGYKPSWLHFNKIRFYD